MRNRRRKERGRIGEEEGDVGGGQCGGGEER